MDQLTPETLIAVFEEIFGATLFWAMVAAALIVTLGYVYVLVRDRAMSMRKFLLAQLSMLFGAVAAVIFVQVMTHSHLRDIGGPVDLIVLLGVAGMDADGRVTAEEARQKRAEIFAMFDQNEDGALDGAEYDLFDETRESDIKENIGEKTGPMAVFSQAMARDFNDTDKDGLVTRDEFLAQASAWFELMDRDKDDLITPGDFGPRKG